VRLRTQKSTVFWEIFEFRLVAPLFLYAAKCPLGQPAVMWATFARIS